MLSKNYSYLASIYPHLMRAMDYVKWADYIHKLSREIKGNELSVLEIACGVGVIANELKNKIRYYYACDLSKLMLARFDNKSIPRLCCNMLALPFKKKFNFIFCTFDSVNYLTKKTEVKRLFSEVSNCLSQNGIFTFDVGLEANSIKYEKYLNRKGNADGLSYKQRSLFDRNKRIHYNIFKIILADGKKVEEIHKQKIYRFEEYFDMIEDSDFYVYNCYNIFSFSDATSSSERAQFILKKKRKNAHL